MITCGVHNDYKTVSVVSLLEKCTLWLCTSGGWVLIPTQRCEHSQTRNHTRCIQLLFFMVPCLAQPGRVDVINNSSSLWSNAWPYCGRYSVAVFQEELVVGLTFV